MNTSSLLIVVEDAGANFSAYSPDLPGCVATGGSREETEKNMYEAIHLHIEGLAETANAFSPTMLHLRYTLPTTPSAAFPSMS